MTYAVLGAEAVCIIVVLLIMLGDRAIWKNKELNIMYFLAAVFFMLLGTLSDFICYLVTQELNRFLYALTTSVAYATEYLSAVFYLFFVAELCEDAGKERRMPLLKGMFATGVFFSVIMFVANFVPRMWPDNYPGLSIETADILYPICQTSISMIMIFGIFIHKPYIKTRYWRLSWSLPAGLLVSVISNRFLKDADFSFVYSSISIFVIHTYLQLDEAKKHEAALTCLSYTDGLTKLFNRNAYALHQAETDTTRDYRNLWYIMVDLDGLKYTNDTHGHKAGDSLILGAGRAISDSVAYRGRVYRLGGDEFAVILKGDSAAVEDIRQAIDRRMSQFKDEWTDGIGYSIGVVSADEVEHVSVEAMERVADERMYADKKMHKRILDQTGM